MLRIAEETEQVVRDFNESPPKINLGLPAYRPNDKIEVTQGGNAFRDVDAEESPLNSNLDTGVPTSQFVSPKNFFGRRTVSLNPERQQTAMRRLEEHCAIWNRTIDNFKSRRVSEDGTSRGNSLLDSQGAFRRRELAENDSYLELEHIYARAAGTTETAKR